MHTTFSTTDEFTASATPRGPPLASIPRRQEMMATIAANRTALPMVNQTSTIFAKDPNDIQKLPVLTPLTTTASVYEAPTAAAMMIADRIGAMTISAQKRGTT